MLVGEIARASSEGFFDLVVVAQHVSQKRTVVQELRTGVFQEEVEVVVGGPEIKRFREFVDEVVVRAEVGAGVGASATERDESGEGDKREGEESARVDKRYEEVSGVGVGLTVEDEEAGELDCLIEQPEET